MGGTRQAVMIGLVASMGVHLGVAAMLWQLPGQAAAPLPPAEIDFEISERPDDPTGSQPHRDAEFVPGGSQSAQNIDGRYAGRGGERTGGVQTVLMLPRADTITLQDTMMNAPDVSQTQRIRSSRRRARSWEERRSTPNPNDQAFVATGVGRHAERRPSSRQDAQEGARIAPDASEEGADVARPDVYTAQSADTVPHAQQRGSQQASPGVGIQNGRGERESVAARVARGRPPVDRGNAATLAAFNQGRVRDHTDAELLAARMLEAQIDTTRRRGREVGIGVGGRDRDGAAGSGNDSREGGRAKPHGPGGGAYDGLDTRDSRYMRWFLSQRRKVERALIFPRMRQLRMDQGECVFRVFVGRDGRLPAPPRIVRSSGYADLDAAALAAIEQSLPFDPIPDELAPDEERLRVDMTIQFQNPMVN